MASNTRWVYGIHSVEAVLKNKKREIKRFCVLKSTLDTFESLLKENRKIFPELVDKGFFIRTFGKDVTHQGCAVLVKEEKGVFLEDIINDTSDSPIVMLDQVTDPHNIGAIVRSCAVFGARAVIVQDVGSPEATSVVAKTASGALEIVPIIRVTNISRTIRELQDASFWCIGLCEEGRDVLSNIDLRGRFAFVIGSEGDGMRRLTKDSCDILAKLPSTQEFSTLNAAQACTVTLYESFRQRCI